MFILCVYLVVFLFFFFVKQKTAYEMRISDWSSDVCSSDLATIAWSPLSAIALLLSIGTIATGDCAPSPAAGTSACSAAAISRAPAFLSVTIWLVDRKSVV